MLSIGDFSDFSEAILSVGSSTEMDLKDADFLGTIGDKIPSEILANLRTAIFT